jgi:hypothetical protein
MHPIQYIPLVQGTILQVGWKEKEMGDSGMFLGSKSLSSITMHFLHDVSLSVNRK